MSSGLWILHDGYQVEFCDGPSCIGEREARLSDTNCLIVLFQKVGKEGGKGSGQPGVGGREPMAMPSEGKSRQNRGLGSEVKVFFLPLLEASLTC